MAHFSVCKLLTYTALGTTALGTAFWLHQRRLPVKKNAEYVALGSSFAAGLGLGERAPNSPIISQRSVNGYPQQLARLLNISSFTDMTSSGATVRHILNGGQRMLGPQIDALGPDTKLVTLTAGGNDVGYIGDLTWMAYQNQQHIVANAISSVLKRKIPRDHKRFADLAQLLKATIQEIKRRSPHAHIVVVTYPVVVPVEGTCTALGLTADQVAHVTAVADQLAQITRDVAKETAVTLVDMATISKVHSVCSQTPWVNGFKSKKGADFHPNLAGAEATAKAIFNVIQPS